MLSNTARAEQPVASNLVTINVDASKPIGAFRPVWAAIGYDEPNYTYSKDGNDLLRQLAQLSSAPIYARTHNLLTSGDGTPALKWGSTHVLSRGADGRLAYDWSIIDRIFDTYVEHHIIPIVEIGFTPEVLSTQPDPYQHHWPDTFATGWSYPPNDYQVWSNLIEKWTQHMVDRYGAKQVSMWKWEVWNEPDIFYWHGTMEEYFKLYDHSVAAIRHVLPNAMVGGPATTGPANPHAAGFLRAFLQHCISGTNAATGRKGAPLDFISFHAKGRASLQDNLVKLDMNAQLHDIESGFVIISELKALRNLPVFLTESDPESCAACSVNVHPEDAFRLNSQYAAYSAASLHATLALAAKHHTNLQGIVAWAFTFPGQPLFAGQRAFSTGTIGLPLLNAFRMFGMLQGERTTNQLTVTSDAVKSIEESNERTNNSSNINAIATQTSTGINVLVWNYNNIGDETPIASIKLSIAGLPRRCGSVRVNHWRVDHNHSNAFTQWQQMNSPGLPTTAQIQQLQQAGQLQSFESPHWLTIKDGVIEYPFSLPQQGVSLLEFSYQANCK